MRVQGFGSVSNHLLVQLGSLLMALTKQWHIKAWFWVCELWHKHRTSALNPHCVTAACKLMVAIVQLCSHQCVPGKLQHGSNTYIPTSKNAQSFRKQAALHWPAPSTQGVLDISRLVGHEDLHTAAPNLNNTFCTSTCCHAPSILDIALHKQSVANISLSMY